MLHALADDRQLRTHTPSARQNAVKKENDEELTGSKEAACPGGNEQRARGRERSERVGGQK